jgi:RimJ/RimL family protein N-acetyltransferase
VKIPNPLPTLRTDRLILRKPISRDVEDRLAMGRDPEIYRMLGSDPSKVGPITREQAQAWCDHIRNHGAAWVIEYDGKAIGEILIHSPIDQDSRASLAIGILDRNGVGKGLGVEAIKAVCAFAFDTIGLHRIAIRVLAFNTRAVAAYEKVGFRQEGRERQSARIGEEWHDDILMGLIASEFAR